MRKTILMTFGAMFAVASLHSCMDFDMPTDTFTGGDTELSTEVYKGKADNIDYRKEISEEGFDFALQKLNNNIAQLPTVQYCMRGGKEGVKPGAHQYQYQYSITVDNYAGYFVVPHNFATGGGGPLASTYYYNQPYSDGPYGSYLNVKNNVINMLNHPQIDSIPELKAIGLLLFDYSAQEVTDLYGSIPYFDHKANKETNPFTFNKMSEIYASIVNNLDTINACLKHYETRPDWYKGKINNILLQCDWVTKDLSIESWRRFANSLKLRMAMHIVKVDPVTAKKWAEEAVQAGVIETVAQEICLDPIMATFSNPLVDISSLWNDTRLNASFESILFSLNHPYTQDDYLLFDKNSAQIVNTQSGEVEEPANSRVVGLRAGIYMTSGQTLKENPRIAYSAIVNDRISQAPLYLMKLSEVQFLRAEGALRGWNMGGSAQQFYEDGIRNAQVENRVKTTYSQKVDAYLNQTEAVAYKYVDPMDHKYDIESVTKIGVKWNEGESRETKLEKIITQKYIAAFPDSYQAWADVRRTGYPKLFEVLNATDGDGSLQQGDLIRKIPLPGRDTMVGLADITSSGLDALGGSDSQATRVWWDVPGPNF